LIKVETLTVQDLLESSEGGTTGVHLHPIPEEYLQGMIDTVVGFPATQQLLQSAGTVSFSCQFDGFALHPLKGLPSQEKSGEKHAKGKRGQGPHISAGP
jgi:hypothetical protein